MNTFSVCLFFISVLLVVSNNALSSSAVRTANFNKDFHLISNYSSDHTITSHDGQSRTLILDQKAGAGFISNEKFLFGQFDMKIKLIAGAPAGTVATFYMTTDYEKNAESHDEIDFEFLGNVLGKPYLLQTNLFINGGGNREERINLWFDPTLDFHTYSVLWNTHQIVFMVDSIAIRAFKNNFNKGIPYPNGKYMYVVSTIWDGSSWATNGGRDKINWAKAPFKSFYEKPKMDGCNSQNRVFCGAVSTTNWWNQERFNSLTEVQKGNIRSVRKHHLVYDFCQKNNPKPPEPNECHLRMF